MKRDLHRLAREEFDLLVVGGGVYGAAVAWDAALRGLSVALVEKGDFASGTTSNSLKVIHGGLRYLQDGNLARMRSMIRERRALLRIAPHLVRPLAFLFPTYGRGLRSRTAFRLALLANEWLGIDRNRGVARPRALPGGRLVSPDEFLDRLPEMATPEGCNGAALWFDAQVVNPERLVLSFLKSASRQGASVANYVEVRKLLGRGQQVIGARVQDQLKGEEFDVRARVTVNAAGPWVDVVLASLRGRDDHLIFQPSLAMNIVTHQQLARVAVGLPQDGVRPSNGEESATIFVVPWGRQSLIGTVHTPYRGDPDEIAIRADILSGLLDRVNRAFPRAGLSPGDVSFIHRGLLPTASPRPAERPVELVREGWLIDHRTTDGWDGLLTVVGVKLTTCRGVAEKAVDWVSEKLPRRVAPCRTQATLLVGAEAWEDGDHRLDDDKEVAGSSGPEEELGKTYGAEFRELLGCLPPGSDAKDPLRLLDAQAVFAVRSEMAQRLSDVVLRRTEIGAAAKPSDELLNRLATTLAHELGWDSIQAHTEIEATRRHYTGRTLTG